MTLLSDNELHMALLSDNEFHVFRENVRLLMCFGEKNGKTFHNTIAGKRITISMFKTTEKSVTFRLSEGKLWNTTIVLKAPDELAKKRIVTDHYGRPHEDPSSFSSLSLPLYHTEMVTFRANRGDGNIFKNQACPTVLAFWLLRFGIPENKNPVILGSYEEYVTAMVLTKMVLHEQYDEDKTA
jgi:hypothetical protein